jgi:hypothetical protein
MKIDTIACELSVTRPIPKGGWFMVWLRYRCNVIVFKVMQGTGNQTILPKKNRPFTVHDIFMSPLHVCVCFYLAKSTFRNVVFAFLFGSMVWLRYCRQSQYHYGYYAYADTRPC